MKFLVITFAPLLKIEDHYFSYSPYVKEMEIWFKYANEVGFCCPTYYSGKDLLINAFSSSRFKIYSVPELNANDILHPYKILKSIIVLYRSMKWADHIHLRCPGNICLLGCFVQILFPHKKKTAKYASNWDWNSHQPWSYRLQQRILRNTFLTRNMTALVYGDWPGKTKNIKPFFTASYSEKDRIPVTKRPLSEGVKFSFVGTLTKNKSPLTCLEVLSELTERGINASLTFCGEGPEREILAKYIADWRLESRVKLLGNVDAETVKQVLIESHFLIFISKSEGWPKAVSEAMWWGCLPITTPVSCVPWMLDNGLRGELVNGNINEIALLIEKYIYNQNYFDLKSGNAMKWAREYTMEKFEEEIKKLI